ncbi:MAG TPA: hypothetical protein VKK79_25880 [Candidatus Lokiarchaeia archaeon]|nr:hypothetical protein [Candidatus Lokiarchaeia archaeon]
MRQQKLARELQSMERMRQIGIHPLDALDQLTHATIELMRAGYQHAHPTASEEEIIAFMRKQAHIYAKKQPLA